MLGKAFSKAKELGSKGLSKSKEYAKDKVHEQKRKIAVDVINSTDNKVKTKQEHLHLDRARQIVVNKFNDGGGVGEEITKEDCREIFYVMDETGKVKNISVKRDDALSFLQKQLKGNGKLSSKVVLKNDWNNEKINMSNIKNYKEPNVGFYSNNEIWGLDKYETGGGVDSEELELKKMIKSQKSYINEFQLNDKEVPYVETKKLIDLEKELADLKTGKMKTGGSIGDDKYVAVHVSKDGYWTIASKPTYKGMAVLFKGSEPKNETFKVVTLEEALNHKKVVGREYLMKTGGGVGFRNIDKIKSNIGETVFNHINSLNKSQLEKQLSELKLELKSESKNTERHNKLKDEEWYILYRLERSSEFEYKDGGGVGEFERLPNSTKSNELYITYNNFKSMYDSLMNGDDFDGKRFQGIINELTNIKNKAKKFKSANEIKGTEYMENGGSTKGFNYSIGGL